MKQRSRENIVAIFAHPDDEAFGPGGTIAKLADNNDVYIICATCGEAGLGPHNNLKEIRKHELSDSAKILGVKKVYFLEFLDGSLSNSLYHQLAKRIEDCLKVLKPKTIITFDPTGMSGHIDHIVVSYVSTFVFYKLPFIKTLMYWCISRQNKDSFEGDYFVYTPPGYEIKNVNKIVDITKFWDIKMAALKAHKSQRKDSSRMIRMLEKCPKQEYFLTIEK